MTEASGRRHAVFLLPGDIVQVGDERPWVLPRRVSGMSEWKVSNLLSAQFRGVDACVVGPMPDHWVQIFQRVFLAQPARDEELFYHVPINDPHHTDQRKLGLIWMDHPDPARRGFRMAILGAENLMRVILRRRDDLSGPFSMSDVIQRISDGFIVRIEGQSPWMVSMDQIGVDPNLNPEQAAAYRFLKLPSKRGLTLAGLQTTIQEILAKAPDSEAALRKAFEMIVMHQGLQKEAQTAARRQADDRGLPEGGFS